jgi:hypothetical protein
MALETLMPDHLAGPAEVGTNALNRARRRLALGCCDQECGPGLVTGFRSLTPMRVPQSIVPVFALLSQ